MSFDNVRKALNELNVVANSERDKAEMSRITQLNNELSLENAYLKEENIRLKKEKDHLKDKADLKESEIQERAETIATLRQSNWLTNQKPGIVQSAVVAEIKRYPTYCTESTRQVINTLVLKRLQEEMKEGWNAIFFGLSNGFKAANRQIATASPIVTVKPLAKAIIIKKPDETK
jgi:hypothetical protein